MSDENTQSQDVIATVTPSLARFWGAIIVIGGFGCFLLWIAASGAAGSALASVIFVFCAALSFYASYRIHQTKLQSLYLTMEGLFDTTGTKLCTMDQIASLDRSFFAFKPSNGFVIRLKEPMDRAWVPGLWWRFGKRLGVGGITSVAQSKSMADTITLLLKGGPELLEAYHNPFAR